MAGVISTSNQPKLLWPGIKGIWGQSYAEHTTEYTDLYDVYSSDKAYEEYVQITGSGVAPVKAQGAPATYDTETQGPVTRMVAVAYALGYIVRNARDGSFTLARSEEYLLGSLADLLRVLAEEFHLGGRVDVREDVPHALGFLFV